MPQKTPQDRKSKDAGHAFTVAGKTYRLPPVSEEAASSIPGGVTMDAIMSPEDNTAQLRLALATLEAVKPTPAAMTALRSLGTTEMLTVVGEWMGESGGSSESSETTGEPSSTTSVAASA
jgi:hypothetical protein